MPVPVILAAALAAVPLQRELKDWTATCDNLRSCTLKALPPFLSEEKAGLEVSIHRDAGGRSALTVTLAVLEGALDGRALQLDGRPLAAPWRSDTDGGGVMLGGDAALAFLRNVKNGRALTLGPPGPETPRASLSGLAAALLVADEAQGRIGTVTAIARPGPAPASTVPAPPPLPVVFAAPPPPPLKNGAALAAAVRRAKTADLKSADCQADAASADEAEPLTAADAVVTLGCLRGAYQQSVLAYRAPRGAPGRATVLDLPPAPGARGDAESRRYHTEGGYDPQEATFVESGKGRGLADCGESSDWTFDGRRFVASGHAAQERCGGQPGDWPTVYRTRTVKRR